jgi:uncharacterized protein
VTLIRADVRDIRTLDDSALPAVRRLIDSDPWANAMMSARIEAAGSLDHHRLGGELLGTEGGLVGACFRGGNVWPIGGNPAVWPPIAHAVGARPRSCSSIVGPADAVAVVWPILARYWGPARLVHANQPLLMCDRESAVEPDPEVRLARLSDLAAYLPAATAMFAEELGLDLRAAAARSSYRARLSELVADGRAFVRLDRDGHVAFKAEIAAVSPQTCQVQGVWVRPDLRGRGLSTSAMAAVLQAALRLAPTASLYVNDFNVPARRLYQRLKMVQVGTLATVMF